MTRLRTHIGILVASFAFLPATALQSEAATTGITAISITRTYCFGTCPDYTLTLRKSGCAHLDGNSNFALIGHFSAFDIDFEQAANAVSSHHYFNFKKEYPTLKAGQVAALDVPIATLTVVRDGLDNRVVTHGSFDTPASLEELFSIIDGIGFTAYWFNDETKEPVATKHTGGWGSAKTPYKPCV